MTEKLDGNLTSSLVFEKKHALWVKSKKHFKAPYFQVFRYLHSANGSNAEIASHESKLSKKVKFDYERSIRFIVRIHS